MECERGRFGSWVKEQCLGSGAFGVVTLWKNVLTQEHIAIKIFKDTNNSERYLNEIEMAKRLEHDNLVKIVPPPEELSFMSLRILCMEYCSEGNLRKIFNQSENCSGLPEILVRQCLKNIKDALEYIHKENIIHRDLKPENIVLQKHLDGVIFKLIDFGYGLKFDNANLPSSPVGTLDYIAPEMFFEEYSSSVDYWSFGIICHEMITGYRPFLPHLSPLVWMEKVQYKTEDVICIYENIFEEGIDDLVFSNTIASENHISKAFEIKITSWLRQALKWNHKKRGRDSANNLIIFNLLDRILDAKIITVYDATSLETFSYIISETTSVLDIKKNIFKDSGHPIQCQRVLSPFGDRLSDEYLVVDMCDPICASAMLYVFDERGISLLANGKSPPPLVVQIVEEAKTPLSYHKSKRVLALSIHFIQTQLSWCEAFYEALAVELLSMLKSLDNLAVEGDRVKNYVISCEAFQQLLDVSINYNEKYYQQTLSNGIETEQMFLSERKTESQSFICELKVFKERLAQFNVRRNEIRNQFEEASSYEEPDKNIEELKKCLKRGYSIYKNLQQMPKELRDSHTSSFDIANVVINTFEIISLFLQDKKLNELVGKSKLCKEGVAYLMGQLETLNLDVKHLTERIEAAHLSLFETIWTLKTHSKLIAGQAQPLLPVDFLLFSLILYLLDSWFGCNQYCWF